MEPLVETSQAPTQQEAEVKYLEPPGPDMDLHDNRAMIVITTSLCRSGELHLTEVNKS